MAGARAQKEKDICFVYMPFNGMAEQHEYYEKIYVPAIKSAGMRPLRADDIFGPSPIISDIWEHTKKAKILIADLSGKNSNVFYELGLAHAIGQPVILIAETLDDVPFDLKILRVIRYSKNDPNWGDDLKTQISLTIKEVLKVPNKFIPANFLENISAKDKNQIAEEQGEKLLELQKSYEMLKSEMRHNLLGLRHGVSREVGPAEAVSRIRRYLADGYPEPLIIERLSSQGVPVSFIMRRIKEFKKRKK